MALIRFVSHHDDLSTDRGYQFKFHCDRCGNGVMSGFQASVLGTASGLLSTAQNTRSERTTTSPRACRRITCARRWSECASMQRPAKPDV